MKKLISKKWFARISLIIALLEIINMVIALPIFLCPISWLLSHMPLSFGLLLFIRFVINLVLLIFGIVTLKKGEGVVAIVTLITIIIAVFIFDFANSEPSIEDKIQEQERQACRNRTDTYNKCSWSAWENMCVCKRR